MAKIMLGAALCLCLIAIPARSESAPGDVPEQQLRGHSAQLPAGTAIHIKLDKRVSTETSKAGEAFSGRITQDVLLDGETVLPAGAVLEGRIKRLSSPRRFRGRPRIDLRPQEVTLPDGEKIPIDAVIVDTNRPRKFDVDDEGRIRGRGRNADDNFQAVAATGTGTIIGAVLGGPAGALAGAATGATASTAYWLTSRHSATLPPGLELILELKRPLKAGTAE